MVEKSQYMFIGSASEVGDRKFETFGTEVALTVDEAFSAIDGGAQFLPKDQFNFTEQEVSLYPFPAFRAEAPEAFKSKHTAALVAVAAHLAVLREQVTNANV